MEIIKNEDGSMATEQGDKMNTIAASILKETFKILSELDTDLLQKADKETSNSILNDVAKQVFNKITEEDIIPIFHEQLGEASSSMIQTVFHKVKQIEEGLRKGIIENAMGVELGEYDNITLKEMTTKLSELQKTE